MNDVSNVKVHLKTRSGNVNILRRVFKRGVFICDKYQTFHVLAKITFLY